MNTKLLWAAGRCTIFLALLWLATLHLRNPYPEAFRDYHELPYGAGDAPDSVRREVLARLRRFQEGYRVRDTSRAESFVRDLFSKDNTLTLGTLPAEIFRDGPATVRLVRGDWASWGDCTFLIEGANVSSEGNVAWFATVGYLESDLSRFMTVPLRLTGVLVKEGGAWRFEQLHFQYDYRHLGMYGLTIALMLLSAGSILVVIFRLIPWWSKTQRRSPGARSVVGW